MATVAISHDIQEGRSLLLEKVGLLAVESVYDSERVISIHSLGIHGVSLESGAQTSREGVTHGLTLGLATHGVLVVHHVEQDRKATLHVTLPEGIELVHRGEGHTLEHRAAGHGTITKVGDDDTLLPVDLLVKSRSNGD